MVRHHVLEGAGRFVKGAAMLDADGFGSGDLHMIDIGAIPKRLDHAVRETEDHQILDSLLAEVMVNAKNLLFGQYLLDVLVQLLRGFEVVAERLFDDHASPLAAFLPGEANFAQLLNDGGKKVRSNRKIVEEI